MRSLVAWAAVVSSAYLFAVVAIYAVFVVISVLEAIRRAHEHQSEDFESLESSRFSLPVSVIVPVYNEQTVLGPVVRSLLDLRYPEFEVIVVNDGSTDGTLAVLAETFALVPVERFHRRRLETSAVRATYASEVEPRLLVIDKENGGKADALNAGVNAGRYPYVCCVDGDTIYRRDALLDGMRLVVRDPERVLAVTSQVSVAHQPELDRSRGKRKTAELLDRTLLANFQQIEYLRSFLNNRLAWSRLGFMLCASGAFALWRRDALVELGGFSRAFTCEDLEITFRAHERRLREGSVYRIVSLPEAVAITEAPARLKSLVAQRARWQRVTLETVWHYRRMLGNPRYGIVGIVGFPFYVLTEALAPLVEVLAFASLAAAIWLGLFSWQLYATLLGIVALANATLSVAAVLLDDLTRHSYRLRHIVWLLFLSPFELVAYRPIIVWARLAGTWGFLRGDRSWAKFARNPRALASR